MPKFNIIDESNATEWAQHYANRPETPSAVVDINGSVWNITQDGNGHTADDYGLVIITRRLQDVAREVGPLRRFDGKRWLAEREAMI